MNVKQMAIANIQPGLYVQCGDADPVCMFTGGAVVTLISGRPDDLLNLADCIMAVAQGVIDASQTVRELGALKAVGR